VVEAPGDDLDAEELPEDETATPTPEPAPAPAAAPAPQRVGGPARGGANPRGRQQRGKKRR
jgi:hypothetical protein